MSEKNPKMYRFLAMPTDVEVGILYLILGINIALATNAVISLSYIVLVYFSLSAFILLSGFRIITFPFVLRAKKTGQFYRRWVEMLLASLAMIAIFWTNIDLAIRVKLSERALYKEVHWIQSLPTDARNRILKQGPRPIGLFNARLYDYDTPSETFWFYTGHGRDPFPPPFSILGGIVYCEQGQPAARGETTYEHLYGHWWRWLQDT